MLYNFLLHLGTAPPQLLLRRGIFYLRKSSGEFGYIDCKPVRLIARPSHPD